MGNLVVQRLNQATTGQRSSVSGMPEEQAPFNLVFTLTLCEYKRYVVYVFSAGLCAARRAAHRISCASNQCSKMVPC